MGQTAADTIRLLVAAGVDRGSPLALVVVAGVGCAVAGDGVEDVVAQDDPIAVVGAIEESLHPRWIVWSRRESEAVLRSGVAVGSCWDIAAVHRLTVGGWRADPGAVWAHHAGLAVDTIPEAGRRSGAVIDLFTAADRSAGNPDEPVRPDGHLRPDWGRAGWVPTTVQLLAWARTAWDVATAQMRERDQLADRPRAALVARSESTVELLCNELAVGGLPVDVTMAESIIAAQVGPRPSTERAAAEQRRVRDLEVLRHVPGGDEFDLRNPGQVRSMLRRAGIEVEDTRAWRLEQLAGTHPVVEPLLAWRKAERIATTFGYAWIDEHVGRDGRLRGQWTGSDGAAGRMTASAGLHNMPAELRPAVVAEPGHAFVRSDLGQIEPRVLAAVSGDDALARASVSPDLYAGVAASLGVERDIAKVAVLGAMYGQTTGRGAQALAGLRTAYPVAMEHLDAADRDARGGRDLCTYGGRRIPMDNRGDFDLPERAARSRAAARGRYGRNAVIQGAAAELFKMWAVTVRARAAPLGGEIVLCLHDELLVHAPRRHAVEVAAIVDAALQETIRRWAPDDAVRFVTDTSVVDRWSDAKS